MALVVDRRAELQGQDGIHALIVGVSDYLNLPAHDDPPADATWFLNKLTSGAISAFTTYEWVCKSPLVLPVKTVRLLLSPSQDELDTYPELAKISGLTPGGGARAKRSAFETDVFDWREDAKESPDDMAIFYFAGHGMQRGPEDGVLLLEDFLSPGGPILGKAFEIGNIRNGMEPSETFANIARTQFYFIDACLSRPETQQKYVKLQVPDVFDTELSVAARRTAPLLFSTVPGTLALGRTNKPSHFAEALKLAMENAAEDTDETTGIRRWPITSMTIKTALDAYYAKRKLGTSVSMGGLMGQPVIRYLDKPPTVDISIQVRPDNFVTPCDLLLLDEDGAPAPQCNASTAAVPGLFETTVNAGFYRVKIASDRLQTSPYLSPGKYITQRGPWPWSHTLTLKSQ